MQLNPQSAPARNDWEEWDEEDFWGESYPQTIEVIEMDEEEEVYRSPILGPDGQPIYYHMESEKQGYIGFVSPDYYLAIREAQSKKRKKRRNARSKKSET